MKILLPNYLNDEQIAKVKNAAPDAEIIMQAKLDNNPDLIEGIEVALDGLRKDDWSKASNLKWYQSSSAGVEGLLRKVPEGHEVIITNAHIHATSMAEHVFGLMISFAHRLNVAYQYQKEQKWDRQMVGEGVDVLSGKTLGIIGLGSVGSRIAELGQAFGMKVIGLKQHPDDRNYEVVGSDKLNYLLSSSDFVVVILPRTKETIHIIGEHELSQMKPSAYIFNLGRGSAIANDALIAALKTGQIKGAGLDVADPEPLPAESPLWNLPNVLITPHTSADTLTYDDDALGIFLKNLRHYQDNESLESVVDKSAGY